MKRKHLGVLEVSLHSAHIAKRHGNLLQCHALHVLVLDSDRDLHSSSALVRDLSLQQLRVRPSRHGFHLARWNMITPPSKKENIFWFINYFRTRHNSYIKKNNSTETENIISQIKQKMLVIVEQKKNFFFLYIIIIAKNKFLQRTCPHNIQWLVSRGFLCASSEKF